MPDKDFSHRDGMLKSVHFNIVDLDPNGEPVWEVLVHFSVGKGAEQTVERRRMMARNIGVELTRNTQPIEPTKDGWAQSRPGDNGEVVVTGILDYDRQPAPETGDRP